MPKTIHAAGRQSRRLLLRLIRRHEPISRAELAARSGLTRPTVSAIVAELVELGLIREIGKGESTGGKRPILLQLAADRHCAIGIDLGEDYIIRGVRVDLHGEVLEEAGIEFDNSFAAIVRALCELVRQLAAGAEPETLRGVGISVTGLVDTQRNEVVYSRSLEVVERDLAAVLQTEIGLPVRLENRPTAAALAERIYGAGRDFRNLLIITSGRGMGVGIIIDGKLFRGGCGAGGELGGQEIYYPGDDPDAPAPYLESRLRPEALTAAASARKGRQISYPAFLELLAQGDPDVTELTLQAADTLAHAVRLANALLDPEAVILSGQLLELGDLFFDRFRAGLCRAPWRENLQVLPSRFRNYGLSPGSASVILERIFDLKEI